MKFAKPQLMSWAGNPITDHNRSPLSIEIERIEKSNRMANGTLRKYIIADKRTFSMSWEMVPSTSKYTVDGFWGANEMEDFWDTVTGSFTLTLNYTEGLPQTFIVVMDEYSKTLNKRGLYNFYDVSVSLVEV